MMSKLPYAGGVEVERLHKLLLGHEACERGGPALGEDLLVGELVGWWVGG